MSGGGGGGGEGRERVVGTEAVLAFYCDFTHFSQSPIHALLSNFTLPSRLTDMR